MHPLGIMTSAYAMNLFPEHPLYRFVNGAFQPLSQVAEAACGSVMHRTCCRDVQSRARRLRFTARPAPVPAQRRASTCVRSRTPLQAAHPALPGTMVLSAPSVETSRLRSPFRWMLCRDWQTATTAVCACMKPRTTLVRLPTPMRTCASVPLQGLPHSPV